MSGYVWTRPKTWWFDFPPNSRWCINLSLSITEKNNQFAIMWQKQDEHVWVLIFVICVLEPVQSCQSTTVVQIAGADSWKERYVKKVLIRFLKCPPPIFSFLLLLLFQAGTHHLKRTDKKLSPLCTGNTSSLGHLVLFRIFSLSDLLGIYHLSHRNHLAASFDKYSPGKTKLVSICSFLSFPRSFSEEKARASLVPFSKCSLLCWGGEKKIFFSSFRCEEILFL